MTYVPNTHPPLEILAQTPSPVITDPSSTYDNVESLRAYLEILHVPQSVKTILLYPWELGYYKISDGKSHPISFMRLSPRFNPLGISLDPVSVLHDYRYYRGQIPRKYADREYLDLQIQLGMPRVLAYFEHRALRLFGWRAWNAHARKRKTIPLYGTDRWIHQQNRSANAKDSRS